MPRKINYIAVAILVSVLIIEIAGTWRPSESISPNHEADIKTASIGIVVQDLKTSNGSVTNIIEVTGKEAKKAGFQARDVITAFNGEPVSNSKELAERIRSYTPGTDVIITVARAGQNLDITTTLS